MPSGSVRSSRRCRIAGRILRRAPLSARRFFAADSHVVSHRRAVRESTFFYVLWGPASPDGPHTLDPLRVRMEIVGLCAPVAAEVDDRHASVEGAGDRVASPAGSAVVVADEHRTMVEHRHVPDETAVSGIAFAQAMHVVGLR